MKVAATPGSLWRARIEVRRGGGVVRRAWLRCMLTLAPERPEVKSAEHRPAGVAPRAGPRLTSPRSATREDPHDCHDRKVSGRHSDPSVHDRDARGGRRGPACTHRGYALAREGDRPG